MSSSAKRLAKIYSDEPPKVYRVDRGDYANLVREINCILSCAKKMPVFMIAALESHKVPTIYFAEIKSVKDAKELLRLRQLRQTIVQCLTQCKPKTQDHIRERKRQTRPTRARRSPR